MRTKTPYDDDYATCVSTSARLRVMSEHLNPDFVTAELQVEPTKQQRRGELPGSNSKHPYKYSGWFLESNFHVQSRDARRHLDWILEQVEGKRDVIAKLRADGALVDVCCVWYSTGQGGPTLSPDQMGRLALLGIELWFDVYFVKPQDAA